MNSTSAYTTPHVRDFLAHFADAREMGAGRFKVRCCCHSPDENPSAQVTITGDGTILYFCQTCKANGDAAAKALGIPMTAFFPPRPIDYRGHINGRKNGAGKPSMKKTKTLHATRARAIEAARFGVSQCEKVPMEKLVVALDTVYRYPDGSEHFSIIRFELPTSDGSKPRKFPQPIYPVPGGYHVGDPAGLLSLLHLPALLASDARLYQFEGEGKAELAERLGLLATTSAHGSNSADKTDFSPIQNREVVIVPDADDAGEKYARAVAAKYIANGCTVKILRLPGLNEGEDIVEWGENLRQSGIEDCDDQYIRAEIERLADAAPFVADEVAESDAGNPVSVDESNGLPRQTCRELILDPKDPLDIARQFRHATYSHPDAFTIHHAGDTFHRWSNFYREIEVNEVRSEIYGFCERAKKLVNHGDNESLEPFKPTKGNIDNIYDAFKAIAFLKADFPSWIGLSKNQRLDSEQFPPPLEIITAQNGLIHLKPDRSPRIFRPPTPLFFSPNALDYAFITDAPTPIEWLQFLESCFPSDEQSTQLLQEWFGYVITLDTRLQKILLMIGPPRSGKGTIARIATAMIGRANVCAPTLSGLATNFGLWSLVGKQLAIISDARLSGRVDQAVITERLLAISGEDGIDIDRKNLPPLNDVKLTSRIWILTNELPRLSDSSGALANRFTILRLQQSFLGREDTGLLNRLMPEMPGILLWAIEGWQRLQRRGHFVQPATSIEAVEEMLDLSSPVGAFVREWCKVGPALTVPAADLYEAWQLWSGEQGTIRPTEKNVFARDLRAAFPGIAIQNRRDGEARFRAYRGVDLTLSAREDVNIARNARKPRESEIPYE